MAKEKKTADPEDKRAKGRIRTAMHRLRNRKPADAAVAEPVTPRKEPSAEHLQFIEDFLYVKEHHPIFQTEFFTHTGLYLDTFKAIAEGNRDGHPDVLKATKGLSAHIGVAWEGEETLEHCHAQMRRIRQKVEGRELQFRCFIDNLSLLQECEPYSVSQFGEVLGLGVGRWDALIRNPVMKNLDEVPLMTAHAVKYLDPKSKPWQSRDIEECFRKVNEIVSKRVEAVNKDEEALDKAHGKEWRSRLGKALHNLVLAKHESLRGFKVEGDKKAISDADIAAVVSGDGNAGMIRRFARGLHLEKKTFAETVNALFEANAALPAKGATPAVFFKLKSWLKDKEWCTAFGYALKELRGKTTPEVYIRELLKRSPEKAGGTERITPAQYLRMEEGGTNVPSQALYDILIAFDPEIDKAMTAVFVKAGKPVVKPSLVVDAMPDLPAPPQEASVPEPDIEAAAPKSARQRAAEAELAAEEELRGTEELPKGTAPLWWKMPGTVLVQLGYKKDTPLPEGVNAERFSLLQREAYERVATKLMNEPKNIMVRLKNKYDGNGTPSPFVHWEPVADLFIHGSSPFSKNKMKILNAHPEAVSSGAITRAMVDEEIAALMKRDRNKPPEAEKPEKPVLKLVTPDEEDDDVPEKGNVRVKSTRTHRHAEPVKKNARA